MIIEKLKKHFSTSLGVLLFSLFCFGFLSLFTSVFPKPSHFANLIDKRDDSARSKEEFNKKLDVIAWEHWLDMFIHEAGHMLLVNAFYQQRAKGDFKVFEPKGFKARLGIKKTLQAHKGGKKVYKFNFVHDGAAYYVITSQKSTTAKKFIRGFRHQYLINLAGNIIAKFFLENKSSTIAHLTAEKLVIGDDDIKKAKNVDKTVKIHLTAPILKKFKWEEKISPTNVKQATIKILLAKQNWKIF